MPHLVPNSLLVLAAAAAIEIGGAAPAANAQYAAGASVGLAAVPLTTGMVRLSAEAGVGRHMSWTAPRTVLALGTRADLGSETRGVSLALSAERTAEADSLAPVFALRTIAWQTMGPVTLHLGLSEHALRFSGVASRLEITQHPDSIETDSGFVIPTTRSDTVLHPGTPGSVRVWPELEAGADLNVGRVRFSAVVGARPAVASFRAAAWGQVMAETQLIHDVELDVTTGLSPARIGLGIPSSRFVSLGVRVLPIHGSSGREAKASSAAAAFAVRHDGASRYTVTFTSAERGRVELAGDFDDWTPVALRDAGHGRREATLTLAPGVHHVSLRVNGGPWFAPPGIPAVPDDFGGTTGILDVR